MEDPFLRSYLARTMPAEVAIAVLLFPLHSFTHSSSSLPQVASEVFADLELFGDRVCSEVDALGREAELNPPQLR